ncbi:hypothetical protein [Burkholderia sp. HI2500]|uniref:hypothetical protein n=1 Tax=Burkholderia sp. HI2500 TaxID=2015358 RepID=UPI000B79DE8D|nr:hypothetical protein [Burkholderia sp. HI2500]OXJ17240.1 hypothetical protein CFB45_12285 [Burkholderia sp. HI2500]
MIDTENEQPRPLSHFTDDEVRAAFERTFSGTRGRGTDGRAIVDNPIDALLDDASRQMGYVEHDRGEGRVLRTPKPAVSAAVIDVNTLLKDGAPVGPGGIHGVSERPAGETLDLRAMIEQHSRVIQAGVRPIWATPRDTAIAIGNGDKTEGLLGFYEDAQLLRVTDPAMFSAVADGADATVGTLPNNDAKFLWPDVPSAAVRFIVDRATNRSLGGGEFLRRSILEAVVRGASLYIDKIFLTALAVTTPPTFSLGAAAAQFIEFTNLRGLIGTAAAAAASIRQDGKLALAGVDAEFTAASTASYVADWRGGGIAIWPEIKLLARRTSVSGAIEFTAFVNAQAVIARPGSFFAVA